MILYYSFIVLSLLIVMIGHCWLSMQVNNAEVKKNWMIIQWIYSALLISPIWIIIAVKSKNIVFDGLLYDVLITIFYVIFLLLFSKQLFKLDWMAVLGLIMCIGGMIIFKIRMG